MRLRHRSHLVAPLLALLAFILVMGSTSVAGTVSQVTNNNTNDVYPQINQSGKIVYSGQVGSDMEVFLFDGTTTTQISQNPDWWDYSAQINDAGQIVWQGFDGHDYDIYMYDNGAVKQISTNTNHDVQVQLNNRGQAAWVGRVGTSDEAFFYDGTDVMQLSSNSTWDTAPVLNDSGMVVWNGEDGHDWEIYLYDGVTVTNLTDNESNETNPRINNAGLVAWNGSDGHDEEIFLYDGTSVNQLTSNEYDDRYPEINESGQLAWLGSDGDDDEIFLYDGASIRQITSNEVQDAAPMINNPGQLVWRAPDPAMEDLEIFIFDGAQVRQFTDDTDNDYNPQINDDGHLTWWKSYNGADNEIFQGQLVTDIDATPAVVNFGDVETGKSATAIVTLQNAGEKALNINSLGLSSGASGFSIVNAPALPLSLKPGQSLDVTLQFAPAVAGPAADTLLTGSDDPDEGMLIVGIDGNGVRVDPPPTQQIMDLLAFYDASIASGDLYGIGSGNSAGGRQKALRSMIEAAGDLISKGQYAEAIVQLQDIADRSDGAPRPPDFVAGDNLAELNARAQAMIAAL